MFTSQLYSWSAFNKTQGCIIMSITESKLMLWDKHSAYQKHSAQYSLSRTQLSFIWYKCTFSSTTACQRTRRNSPRTTNAAWSTLIASCIQRVHLCARCLLQHSTLTSSVPGWLISFVSIDSIRAASWLMSVIFNLTQCPLITSSFNLNIEGTRLSHPLLTIPHFKPLKVTTAVDIRVGQISEWIWIGYISQEAALELKKI